MYISFRVFYLRYWERLCCTSCMARGQISWVDISVRIISTSQFFLHLLQAIRIWNFVVFHPSDQDQVDGTGVWSIHPVPVGNRQSRIAHSGHFITFKFCRVLFIQQEFKTVYTKRTGAQSKIQTTDKTAYDLCKWCKTPLCCLWENRVG